MAEKPLSPIEALKAIRAWLAEYALDYLGEQVTDTHFETPWLIAGAALEAVEGGEEEEG